MRARDKSYVFSDCVSARAFGICRCCLLASSAPVLFSRIVASFGEGSGELFR